ncbi:uncharacterized protein LOC142357369 isoform X2 [Convolutriloba macropyga]|uniref:uncharacterized protein LOC142357369 isoform X2 n=1 Tax=Convolutriloba macropyga TaxID=536237 RepID=UPI003F5231D9
MSNLSWIATDSDLNRETFSSLLKNDPSMSKFRTLGINVDGILKRLAIGTMSSNVLEYAYQLRSVEDPAASDHTLSLDTYYNPLLRLKEPTYHIISSDYLYKCDQPISHAQRDSSNPVESKFWPLQLTHAEKNYVQQFLLNHTLLFIDERLLPENGLLKIAFSNSQIQPNCFYTPYYNLRKTSQTID